MTTSERIDHARLWHELADEDRRHHDAVAAIITSGRELAASAVEEKPPAVAPLEGESERVPAPMCRKG